MAGQELASRPTTATRGREWMSIDDFCAELGITASTAYKWSSTGPGSGRFPRYRKLPNGSIRIRRDWFEEWIDGLGPSAS